VKRPSGQPNATSVPRFSHSAALRRRREASRRLPVLDCGRSDPWHYDEVPLTDHQLDGAADAAEHLLALGLAPVFDMVTIRALWPRDRELSVTLARLAGAA
jgi:hypothetical protein